MSLPEYVQDAINARLADAMFAGIGRIESFDSDTMTASVLPLITRLSAAPVAGSFDKKELPVISDIPVVYAHGDFFIRVPYKSGELVKLAFSAHDLTAALSGGQGEFSRLSDLFNLESCFIDGHVKQPGPVPDVFTEEDGLLIGHVDGMTMIFEKDQVTFKFDDNNFTVIDKDGVKTTRSAGSVDLFIHVHPSNGAPPTPT